jgi:hypothetical protein
MATVRILSVSVFVVIADKNESERQRNLPSKASEPMGNEHLSKLDSLVHLLGSRTGKDNSVTSVASKLGDASGK